MNQQVQEAIDAFYQQQFMQWPLAAENYARLDGVKRRTVGRIIVQCNPARIVSTGADLSKVPERKCFLCESNRPAEQMKADGVEGFDILINPFPIFPVHFTISAKEHTPQGEMPLEMVEFADRYPGLVAFFNGAKAGASAPDHLHFQAVRADEVPLLARIEQAHSASEPGAKVSADIIDDAHVPFVSVVIPASLEGLKMLSRLPKMHGDDAGLVNTFVWKDAGGVMRALVIPRKAHRPWQYSAEGTERLMISPGALDMAGVMIAPRSEDYEKITAADITDIYAQTGSDVETARRIAKILEET